MVKRDKLYIIIRTNLSQIKKPKLFDRIVILHKIMQKKNEVCFMKNKIRKWPVFLFENKDKMAATIKNVHSLDGPANMSYLHSNVKSEEKAKIIQLISD